MGRKRVTGNHILEVLEERGLSKMSFTEISSALRKHGHNHTNQGLSENLERLQKEGLVGKVNGSYCLIRYYPILETESIYNRLLELREVLGDQQVGYLAAGIHAVLLAEMKLKDLKALVKEFSIQVKEDEEE